MTLTWSPQKQRRSFGPLGRLFSFMLAAALCALLVYLALTQRFGAIAEIIDDTIPIEFVPEIREAPPPLPPPPVPQRPPEAQRPTPTNTDAPPTPTFEPVDKTPAPPAPATAYIDAAFTQRPDGRDYERFFPRRALERGMSGNVVLDCTVAADTRLSCAVASETPAGWGFGDASLRAAQQFRVAPATADGHPTSGGRLRVPMSWRVR